ncbi:MAG TPA: hypothetical protein VOB72_11625 [Candidatus Dormibacteraeota bacterium]|nr:hypothetical protein [Candidatus Dormibacteraeota bacterium]
MIHLARVPVQLTPRQSVLVAALAIGLLLAVMAAVLLESVLGGVVGLFLRLTGHKPPRKSAFSSVLDDFERRTRQDRSPEE